MDHRRECVWDYPRPPRLELVPWIVRVEHHGEVIAAADQVHRVLETTHPPVYYIPAKFVADRFVRASSHRPSRCEWKGLAHYHDLFVSGSTVAAACWSYPEPTASFEAIAGAVAFYPTRVDLCTVDGERVSAQPGDFYGGWISSWIDGGRRGFKGGPGTWGW